MEEMVRRCAAPLTRTRARPAMTATPMSGPSLNAGTVPRSSESYFSCHSEKASDEEYRSRWRRATQNAHGAWNEMRDKGKETGTLKLNRLSRATLVTVFATLVMLGVT